MNTNQILVQLTNLFKNTISNELVGVYLHGSLAMGCYNSARSDIDLLVVVNEMVSKDMLKQLAARLLLLESELSSTGGFELSIVLKSNLDPFIYPTPFEFHYSGAHRDRYRTDESYLCGGYEDGDLAAHLVVAYERGTVLYGKPIREWLTPIPAKYFVASILSDVAGAVDGIVESPIYYVLNLCRAFYYLREGKVASKKEGGEWAISMLPLEFSQLVSQCLTQYGGEADPGKLDDMLLRSFAAHMQQKIRHASMAYL